jgi:nicotinate phosphoribosyltransferase
MPMPHEFLLTDLYQLTMLNGYLEHGMNGTAVFEFFARKMPAHRGFLVAIGLEQLLEFLESLALGEEDCAYLTDTLGFKRDFVRALAELRFTGDVDAVPEGTIVFENEPIVRITAPLPQAQLAETRLINLIHFGTVIASKAARSVLVAKGRLLVDFGLRRAHGFEAGLLSARASYAAGFDGTSTVLAGQRFGIPLYGTMAHSFVQAHASEKEAFLRFAESNPRYTVLLVDTYDTEDAVRGIIRWAPELARQGLRINGVRLDSGDLAAHAFAVRKILDDGAMPHVRIFASSSLDEYAIRDLVSKGAPIDGFGVGTHMNTSADAPYLDCAYKLEEYDGKPRRKVSEGKATWPGRKQVFRRFDTRGVMAGDTVTTIEDAQPGQALLVPVLRGGRRVDRPEPLLRIRSRVAEGLAALPAHLRALEDAPPYPVAIARALRVLAEAADESRSGRSTIA